MTLDNIPQLKGYPQEAVDAIYAKRDRIMQAVSDEREKARRRLDPIHELRARQAFRRQTNPCPGGAC